MFFKGQEMWIVRNWLKWVWAGLSKPLWFAKWLWVCFTLCLLISPCWMHMWFVMGSKLNQLVSFSFTWYLFWQSPDEALFLHFLCTLKLYTYQTSLLSTSSVKQYETYLSQNLKWEKTVFGNVWRYALLYKVYYHFCGQR